jgi:hypothetical protein
MSTTVRVFRYEDHAQPTAAVEDAAVPLDPSGTHAADCSGRLRWETGSALNPGLKRLTCRRCGGVGTWFPR